LDGKIMPEPPAKLYAQGRMAHVPLMVGATSMDILPMKGKTIDDLLVQFGPDAARARTVYEVKDEDDFSRVAAQMGGDQLMVEPARYVAREWAAHGIPVYAYRFSYVAESLRKQLSGAPHASDIPFAFDTVLTKYGKDLTEGDAAAARAMHAYWVAFAKNGKLQVEGQLEWTTYDPRRDLIMNFTNLGPVVGPDSWRVRLDLAERFNEAHAAAPR
jgi:para-nitrobenzyl esterase